MDIDSGVATAAVILGFAMPPVISALNRERWSSTVKGVTAFVLCVIVSLAVLWYEDKLNTTDIRNTIGIVFGLAIFTYHQYWSPSGISDKVSSATG